MRLQEPSIWCPGSFLNQKSIEEQSMRFPSWSFETTKYIYISLLWISLSIPVFLHIDQKHRLQVNITPQGPHLASGWLPANLQEAMNNGFPYPETITASGRPRKSRVDMKHTPTCHVSYYLWGFKFQTMSRMVTLTKFNKDTKNYGLWIVYPFKYGCFWYLCSISGWLCYVSFFFEYLIVCFYVFIDILRKDDHIFPPGTSLSFVLYWF